MLGEADTRGREWCLSLGIKNSMLEQLKGWATTWVASILIGLLILSFAIWGVADVFRGYGQGSLAKVGSQPISAEDFRQTFQNEVQSISQRSGQRITFEQARAVGLDRTVLSRMINTAAVEAHAEALGLKLSDATLADQLKTDPAFQGADGKFSKERFDGVLRQIGLSEQSLLELRRRDQLREQIVSAMTRATAVPEPITKMLHDFRKEARVVEYATIDAEEKIKIGEPDEAALKKKYEENKTLYMTRPTRHLAALVLSVDALKKKAKIPEEQIKEAYEQTKESYDKDETRRILQISFKDKAAAEKAKKEIEDGKSFIEVAKANGALEPDIDLGYIAKKDMIDPKIAEAAFKLEKNKVSDVVEGVFTNVLLEVTDIKEGQKSTYETAKDKVRDLLAAEIAQSELQKYYAEIDDGRASGKPLKDIAEGLQIPFYDIPSVDSLNRTADGKKALDIPAAIQIVGAGFKGEIGIEQAPVELEDGGYAWVDVLGTTDPKQKLFEDVKETIKTAWIEGERSKALAKLAGELVDRLNGGEDFEKLAKEMGGKLEKTLSVTRATIPEGLTQSVMSQAFVMDKGQGGSAETNDGKSRTIFRVVEVTPATKPTEAETGAIERELKQQLELEQSEEYVSALRKRFGVSINEPEFKRVTGADQ